MTQKVGTRERVLRETTLVERVEGRAVRQLRLQIEELEARISPDVTGDPIPPVP